VVAGVSEVSRKRTDGVHREPSIAQDNPTNCGSIIDRMIGKGRKNVGVAPIK